MEHTDASLVEKALLGEAQAFTLLVQKHLAPLYSFVFLIMRDKDTTEDVVQETFIKAWKHLKRFDHNQSFKTWLYTIAKNTAFDFLKKKKAIPFSSFEDAEGNMPLTKDLSEEPDVLERLSREAALLVLEKVLDQMPPLYRTLLVLVYREDFDLHEAAIVLGEPYNTIKSRHQRALQKLRALSVVASGELTRA